MIKLILKTIIIVVLCTTTFLAKAQLGYDYAQYDVGFAVGINTPVSTDVPNAIKNTPSAHFNFNYNQSPFVNYIFEGQFGRLKAGDVNSVSGRKFENHFTAFALKVQLQAGEVIDYSQSGVANAFKNLYLSSGIGYIINKVTNTPDKRVAEGTKLPGDNNSQIPFIPVRLGYEFKIFNQYNEPSVKIDLGYQYNFLMDDNLDGYSTGAHKDVFSQFTVGVKFAIGGVTSYRKQIYY
ncbi:hypothetical protein [Mucilaginibacter sp. SP1R1]|uniref:hypothetical protein n=1 Tax=Mucilaginibacter sp. SP1R1 TaxID=2723091 RepID=UPI00160CAB83|nr:hypothetical protein [Mucilaginibacter sp. SP1R1]MBB6147707.1 hypothetical protein [Mucilaginibacter sp. SP1R1]